MIEREKDIQIFLARFNLARFGLQNVLRCIMYKCMYVHRSGLDCILHRSEKLTKIRLYVQP
jgi:hypothetical protein